MTFPRLLKQQVNFTFSRLRKHDTINCVRSKRAEPKLQLTRDQTVVGGVERIGKRGLVLGQF